MAEQLRGLAFPGSSVAVEQPEPALFNISERADLAVATYSSLGLVADKSAALEDFTAKFQAFHDSLVEDYYPDEPELEPFIGLELTDSFGLMALIAAFDKRQSTETYVDHPIWDQVSLEELSRRTLHNKVKTADTAPAVNGQALAMVLGGDRSDAPGLYFTGKDLKAQLKAVQADRKNYAKTHADTERLLVNPGDTIIINAQRREAGQELLDKPTYSRYVQIDKKPARGGSWVPGSRSDLGQLGFDRSRGDPRSGGGVRLLVGQVEA